MAASQLIWESPILDPSLGVYLQHLIQDPTLLPASLTFSLRFNNKIEVEPLISTHQGCSLGATSNHGAGSHPDAGILNWRLDRKRWSSSW